jgi:monoamine oxidase
VPTVEVSLLDLLFNVQVCGVSAELLAESEGGAQTKRFVGGTSQIPLRLAERLKGRILLESPVVTIDQAPRSGHGGLPRRQRGDRPAGDRGAIAHAGGPDHV